MLDLDHLEKAQRVSLTMQVEHSLKGALRKVRFNRHM